MSNKGSKEAEARVKGKSEDKRKVIIVLEKACLEAVKTKKVDLFSLSLRNVDAKKTIHSSTQ